MSQAMTLYAGSVGVAGVAADSQVRLASPYIHLASTDNSGSLGVHYATPNLDNTSQPLIGGLTLEASQLLEVRGGRGLGNGGQLTFAGELIVRPDRKSTRLNSSH